MIEMLRLLGDEDFDNDILRGVLRRVPALALLRVQDAGLAGCADPDVLDFAAGEGRALLTHDVNTMLAEAHRRVAAGLSMYGVIAVPQSLPIGQAIEDLTLLAECSVEGEWRGRVVFLPV